MRRGRVIATLAISIVVFALPAAARATGPFWYVDDKGGGSTLLPEAPVTTFTGDGLITFAFGPVSFQECGFDVHGYVWNGPTIAEGEIDQFTPTEGCGGPGEECVIEKLHASPSSLPWSIQITGKDGVDVKGITITATFSKQCGKYGLVETSFSGTATGTLGATSGCFEYNNSGDLFTESKEPVEVKLTGNLCPTPAGGERLTLK
jgi:hypothetical protein